MLLNLKKLQNMHYAWIYSLKGQNMQTCTENYNYLESLSHKTNICKVWEV